MTGITHSYDGALATVDRKTVSAIVAETEALDEIGEFLKTSHHSMSAATKISAS